MRAPLGVWQVRGRLAAAAGLAAALALACFEPDQPAAVTVSPAAATLDALGATVQLTATVTDKAGKPLTTAAVTWASSDAAVASVDATGKVTALKQGTTDVTASAGAVTSSPVRVTVAQTPTKVDAVSGAQQVGTVGQPLPQQLVVRVRDRLDQPVAGAAVTFTVSENGGSVSPASGNTGTDGQLAATWTLGTKSGNYQVSAAVTGSGFTAVFNAKANPGPADNMQKAGGDGQFGYQGTLLAQLVAVRVRDQYGNGVPSHPVEFTPDPGSGSVDSSLVFTDTAGVARTSWRMPSSTGPVTLQAKSVRPGGASALLGSPATFSATSHNVRVESVSPASLMEGQAATLTGTGFDGTDPARNVVTIDGVAAAVAGATSTQLTVTVPTFDCKPARSVSVQVTVGGIPAAPVAWPLNPAAPALNLAVGQQRILTDPAQFCFQFGATAAGEGYLIGVQSASEAVATLTPITLVGTAAGGAAAAPALRVGGAPVRQAVAVSPQQAARWERWARYREAERAERALDQRVFAERRAAFRAPAPGRTPGAVGPDLNVGDTVRIRVHSATSCSSFTEILTRVAAKGSNVMFLADTANPAPTYSSSQFSAFAQQYDDKIYPADTAEFGAPLDIDGNGRIVVVVTKEVNRRGSLGFTTSCDNFPRDSTNNRASNYGEFFYMVAPDPNGAFGRAYSLQAAAQDLPDIIAHESVHVIQFGRRLASGGPFPDIWIAEGQAVLGEEVSGHAVENHEPGQNLGLGPAANLDDTLSTDFYGTGFVGLGLYFGWDPITAGNSSRRVPNAPQECSFLDNDYGGPCVGGLEPYGPSWSLLRYLNDRFFGRFGATRKAGEAAIQRAFVNHTANGFAMVQSVLGVRMDSLLAQWAAMLFADDSVPNLAPELRLDSWNLKDIFYGTYNNFRLIPQLRLQPATATFGSFTKSANVRAASTYYTVLSGANRPATAVKARDAAGGILPAHMRYWILRIQ